MIFVVSVSISVLGFPRVHSNSPSEMCDSVLNTSRRCASSHFLDYHSLIALIEPNECTDFAKW